MKPVFLVSVLVLESDAEARAFFHGTSTHDLKTLAGGPVQFFIPESIEDAFSAKGIERFPDLERADLSCLWVEDQTKAHFKIPLQGKTAVEIRAILTDLGDGARKAANLQSWRDEFNRRQAKRSLTPAGSGTTSNPTNVDQGGSNHLSGEITLLVRLGKIAGIAGIGAGIFFMLFARLAFPTLAPEQANLFMLLAYGFGVLALVASAASSPDGRFASSLLAVVGIVLGVVGLFVLRPSDGSEQTVQITLRSPNGSPVENAKIWCSPLCTPKSVSGGWEISVSRDSGRTAATLTVNAEVADRGWQASTDVRITKDRLIPVTLQLQETGNLRVLGVVVDSVGVGIPNARVGRYGDDPVSTDANGGFRLNTNERKGTKITIRAASDNPKYAPAEVEYEVGKGELRIVLSGAKEPSPVRSGSSRSNQSSAGQTGDPVIDRVLATLATLKRGGTPAESDLSNTLAILFSRPTFYEGILNEDWRYFLYTLCRTRILLESYVGDFKTQPKVRGKISEAIQKMVALQNQVALLYGPTFSVTQHIDRYVGTRKLFVERLPAVVQQPGPEFFNARDRDIREIMDLLKDAGLPVHSKDRF